MTTFNKNLMIIFIRYYFIILFFLPLVVNSQGIRFNSSESSIAQRTSYNLFKHNQQKFIESFSIDFKLSIIDPKIFGYVLNIKDKNSSISYSLVYVDNVNNSGELKLNLDGVKKILSVPLENKLLGSRKWIDVTLKFNSISKKITLSINDEIFSSTENEFNNTIVPEIFFGKHGSIIDVPSMAIKDLKITNKNNNYDFNFNEISGNNVYDSKGILYGRVDYPNWLIRESYNWKLINSKTFNKVTSVTFDEKKNRFIFQNSDSLGFYNFINHKTIFNTYKNSLPVSMRLGTSFLDTVKNKLYVYELSDILNGSSTIASINLQSAEFWNENSSLRLTQQRHHHNGFFDPDSYSYIVFGGYGNKKYTNNFNTYNIKNNVWESTTFTGDIISPRFFSGMTQLDDENLLLFGGLGNKTGDQSIGKTYHYDCYKINLKTKEINKLWDNFQENKKMVSSRSLVLSKDSNAFYNLSYSEFIPSTYLQLHEYSLKDGSFKVLGDSIPMISEKIRTNANLYFNTSTNQFLCTTQEFQENGSSKINIYTLNGDPVSKENIYPKINIGFSNKIVYLILLIFVLLVIYYIKYFFSKRKKKKEKFRLQIQKILKPYNKTEAIEIRANSTFLFGIFRIYDRNKKDISYLFSPKIRQLFLLLLFSSNQKAAYGLTSEKIHSAIWPDFTQKKAKNLKNVCISQLRNILKDIDGLKLTYSRGKYYLELEDKFYCDYFKFLVILESLTDDQINYNSLNEITNLISPGKFLQSENNECFDIVKKDFEHEILKIIPFQIKRMYLNKNYSQIILLTNILFNIDPLNETAFYYRINTLHNMDLTSKAKKQFNDYILRYHKIMGDNYPKTYKDVIKEIPTDFM